MTRPPVTVVVVPRERFGATPATLDALFAATPPPFGLVVVDGGAPRALRRRLEADAAARGFRLVGDGRMLLPNAARNAGLAHVTTPWVVFLDNDVVVAPGWLDALLDAAVATGAAVVAPLYCVDRPLHTKVHMAAGLAHVEVVDGRRRMVESHASLHRPVAEVRREVRRGPCEQAEFHAMLVRTDVLRALGPLDEAYLGATEAQLDFSMAVRAAGHAIVMEPDALVTYDRPTRLAADDLPYFLHRWSEAGTAAGLAHFQRRFGLDDDDPYLVQQRRFLAWHRQVALHPLDRWLRPLGRKRARDLAARLVARKAARIEARRLARA